MKWLRLKNMKCPRCNEVLERFKEGGGYVCKCGFSISNEKFNGIINKIYKKGGKGIYDPDKNLSNLNNL